MSLRSKNETNTKSRLELEKEDWYHGMLPREDIAALLKDNGNFLVRLTEPKQGQGMRLVLSVRWAGRLHNMIISEVEGFFYIEHFKFQSVPELIRHYVKTKKPVTVKSGAQLTTPVPRQDWELKHEQVELGKMLGEGAFGGVYMGTLNLGNRTVKVAVKVHKGKELSKEMIKEMCKENIVRFYGVAMEKEPIMLVMELVDGGSLDKFLQKNASKITIYERVKMCYDAAKGLEYLHDKGCIHRLAPETLTAATYSTKSDVFSYGIMMWEIFSDGRDPYPGMTIGEVNLQVRGGYRMPPPDLMPPLAAEVMSKHCFPGDPDKRYSMMQIRKALEELIEPSQKAPRSRIATVKLENKEDEMEKTKEPGELKSRY